MKKSRMNKVLAVLLCLAMTLSLCACGKKNVEEQTPDVGTEQTETAKDPAAQGDTAGSDAAQGDPAKDAAGQTGSAAAGTGSSAGSNSTGKKPSAVKTNASVGSSAAAGSNAGAAAGAAGNTPAAQTPAQDAMTDTPAEETKTETVEEDKPLTTGLTYEEDGVVPHVEVAEVASEAELLAAMKAEKVSAIKTTQNISLTAPVEVTGNKTISGAKITAASKMDAMYVVAEGASLTIKECVIDAASKAENIVLNNGTASVVNSELKGAKNGALYNNGVMAVNYVTISDCKGTGSGGAVKNHGDMAIKNSTFKNNKTDLNGGAIFSSTGSVTKMESCTFSGNTATKGGGAMWINSDACLKNCIFEDNTCQTYGGAVYLNYTVTACVEGCKFYRNNAVTNEGGGLYAKADGFKVATVTVDDCYFEKNLCGQYGAGLGSSAAMTLTNSKFVNCDSGEHGGAVANTKGKMEMFNCEVIGCTAVDRGGAIRNGGDMIIRNCSFRENLSYGQGGGAYYAPNYGNANIYDCTFDSNRATTGFGGAVYLYSSSSSASGASFENCTFTNNRAKTQGGGIYSMGWVELLKCKFDKCVAETDSGGAYYNKTANLKMYDCEVTNCSGVKNGGAVYNNGICLLKNSKFVGNYTEKSGGVAYFNSTSKASIVGCTFENNKADTNGGALYTFGNLKDGQGVITVTDSTFKNNSCPGYGGAIRNHAKLTVRGCSFESNTAEKWGGAIYNNALGVLSVAGSKFNKNTADLKGGAMAFGGYTDTEDGSNDSTESDEFEGMSSQVKIVNCDLYDNSTEGATGGSIYSSGNVEMSGVTIARSSSLQNGGGYYNNGVLIAEDCNFIDCETTYAKTGEDTYSHGGAIYMSSGGRGLELTRCTFDGNYSYHYGGAVAVNGSLKSIETQITGCTFKNNSTNWRGGAVSNTAIMTIKGSEFYGNESTERQGGAIYNYYTTSRDIGIPGRLSVIDCDIYDNSAVGDGGGIYNAKLNGGVGEVTVEGSTIVNNVAGGYGGAITTAGPLTIDAGNTIGSNEESSEGDIYVTGGDAAKLTVKGSGNDIESIRLAAGKTITAGKSYLGSSTKIYTDGSVEAGESVIEGGGSAAVDTDSGDGRYEIEDGKLVAATHKVTLPDGVTCVSGADSNGDATYGTDYVFKIPAGSYELSVLVGGSKTAVSESTGNKYTIGGEAITADVVITLTEVAAPSDLDAADEAYILAGTDTKAHGALVDVVAAADADDVIYLVKDVELASELVLDKALTLTTADSDVTVKLGGDAKISVSADVMISGKKGAALTIDGNGETRKAAGIEAIGSAAKLTLGGNLTVTGMNNQNMTTTDSGSVGGGLGGGLYVANKAAATVSGTEFLNNTTNKNGGAICVSGAQLTVTDGVFDGNKATGGTEDSTNGNFGAAIYSGDGASVNLLGGSYTNNECARYGSVLAVKNASAIVKGISNMTGNTAVMGTVYAAGSSTSITISDVTASGNTASSRGGFAYIGGGVVTLGNNVKISDNSGNGGNESIYLYSGDMKLKGAMELGAVSVRTEYYITMLGNVSALAADGVAATITVTCSNYTTTPLFAGKTYISASKEAFRLKDNGYLINNDGTLSVDPNPFKVNQEAFSTMDEAVAYANSLDERATIKVMQDVTFDEPVTYKINPNVDFGISSDVTISGPATFDGQDEERSFPMFTIDDKVTFQGVTVINCDDIGTSGGGYGAAFRVNTGKALVLDGVTVKNCSNARGAIYSNNSKATIEITNCIFEGNLADPDSGNGGAVLYGYSTDSSGCFATISNSTFRNNHSNTNGGVFYFTGVTGAHTITDCVFENNSADGLGGVIYNSKGTVTVDGCTFTDNTAGGVANDMVACNASTVKLAGKVDLKTVTLSDLSKIELDSSASFTDKVDINCTDVGKQILTGSGVAEKYTNFNPLGEDQYFDDGGYLRGIVYVASVSGVGYTTLEEAVEAAAKNGDVILLDNIEFTSATTIDVSKGVKFKVESGKDITVSGPVTFDGKNTTTATVNIFNSNGKLTLKDVTIKDYVVAKSGDYGVIRINDTGVFENVTFENCASRRSAIYSSAGTVTVKGCTFTGNASTVDYGGAIGMYNGGTLTVEDSTFTNNTAVTKGGAININNAKATATISGSTFTGNTVTGSTTGNGGGALYLTGTGSVMTVTDCEFTGNEVTSSAAYGGVIRTSDKAELTMVNCTMTGNIVNNKSGSAIYTDVATVLDGCTIKDNVGSADPSYNVYVYNAGGLTVKGECDIEDIGLSKADRAPIKVDGVVTGSVVFRATNYTTFATKALFAGDKLAESLSALKCYDDSYVVNESGCVEAAVATMSLFEAPAAPVADPLKAMQEVMSGELLPVEEESAPVQEEVTVEETAAEPAAEETAPAATEAPVETAAPTEEAAAVETVTEEKVEVVTEA